MKTYIHCRSYFGSFLHWMRNVSDKICRENRNTTFGFNIFLFPKSWQNIVKQDMPQMKIWCMRTACWIPKATNTPSWYVIVITFLPQQSLCERASILRYSFIACHVYFRVILSHICFYMSSTRLVARSNMLVSGRPLAGGFLIVLC